MRVPAIRGAAVVHATDHYAASEMPKAIAQQTEREWTQ
jgi:hypothetical protein